MGEEPCLVFKFQTMGWHLPSLLRCRPSVQVTRDSFWEQEVTQVGWGGVLSGTFAWDRCSSNVLGNFVRKCC